LKLQVVYEDGCLLAVDKPAGQLVIPGRGAEAGPVLVDAVSRHLGVKAFVVHRIDRETSGLVLFAKDAATHAALSKLFEKRRVRKSYLAVVSGTVPSAGRITAPIREFGSGRMGVDPRGKDAETKYRPLRTWGDPPATLLEVEPRTGRRHQIRVHLYSIGHPVLGDSQYGRERPVGGGHGAAVLGALPFSSRGEGGRPRLMLHAYSLLLPPHALWGRRRLEFRAEPPPGFPAPADGPAASN